MKPAKWFLGLSLLLLSLAGYLVIALSIPRFNTIPLFFTYFLLFLMYAGAIYCFRKDLGLKGILISGLILRAVLVFNLPSLSDDYFRLAWDGKMLTEGINPYAHTPQEILKEYPGRFDQESDLVERMNSLTTHSIYPPLDQGIYYVATLLFPRNLFYWIVLVKLIMLMAEGFTLYFLFYALKNLNGSGANAVWYAWNPLIILELTGNLHSEGFMMPFLALSLFAWSRGKTKTTALALSGAVLTRLFPLVYLGSFLKRTTFKQLIQIGSIIVVATIIVMTTFLWGHASSYFSGIQLYFQKFEFNASIYFIARGIGFWYKGYNIIATLGKWLPGIFLIFLVWFWWKADNPPKMQLPESWMWITAVYYFLSSIIHPWYIIPVFALSLFTRFRFPVVWTALIFLSYAGYTPGGYSHPYLLITVEYLGVFAMMFWEIRDYYFRPS